MNNTLLFIVIGIIAVAIIALLVLKKLQDKQGKLPRPPSVDKQTNIKVADPRQLPESTHSPSQQIPQAPKNELATVETYISHQDYTSAINELKRLLMTNPRHTQAMLKLLQVYGLTGQMTAFNQLYQKICEIADEKTVQEAGFLKSILEPAPQAQPMPEPVPAPAPVAKPIEIDSIDFEATKPAPIKSAPVPTPAPVVEMDADDVLELDFNLDDKPAPQQIAQPVTQQEDGLSFEFETTPPAPKASVVEPVSASDVEALSFEFESPAPAPTTSTQPNTTNELDSLDFDFNINEAKDVSPAPQAIVDTPVATNSTPAKVEDEVGFDFDFGLDEPAKPTIATPSTPTKEPEPEIVFDLDTLETSLSPSTNNTPIIEPAFQSNTAPVDKTDDFEFEFDAPQSVTELSFDLPQETKTNVADNHLTAQSSDPLSFDDFELEPTTAPASVTPSKTSLESEPSLDLAEFDVHFDANTKAPADDLASLSFDTPAFEPNEVSLDLGDSLTAKPQQTAEPSFDLSDFELDIDADKPAQDLTDLSLEAPSTPEASFELEMPATPVTAPEEPSFDLSVDVSEPIVEQTLVATSDPVADEFAWDELEISPTATTTDEPSFDLDVSAPKEEMAFDVAPAVAEPEIPVVAPVTSVPVAPEESLTPSDDGIQITLELAKQYVEFGEYDSAKRLLQEVSQEGTTTQKQEAHTLMVMIA